MTKNDILEKLNWEIVKPTHVSDDFYMLVSNMAYVKEFM